MEEFEKIDWIPSIEDIVDDKFVTEQRLQSEGAMYQIMNGTFQDPFLDIRPRAFQPKEDATKKMGQGTAIDNKRKYHAKRKRVKPKKNKQN